MFRISCRGLVGQLCNCPTLTSEDLTGLNFFLRLEHRQDTGVSQATKLAVPILLTERGQLHLPDTQSHLIRGNRSNTV